MSQLPTVEGNLHLVQYHAQDIHASLPPCVELDDLIQDGVFGLMEAVRDFQPARGVKFTTFSAHRIRGAIFDALRQYSWYPRLVLERRALASAARERCRQQLGHDPAEQDLARVLSPEAIEEVAHSANVGPIQPASYSTHPSVSPPVQSSLESAEIRAAMLVGLERAERLIIQCYFFEGMSMKETAGVVGVTESYISQRINGCQHRGRQLIGLIDRLQDRVRLRQLAEVPLDAVDLPRPRSEEIRHAVHGYSSISQNRKRWPVVRKGAAAARREGSRRQGSPAGATAAQSGKRPAQDGHCASHPPIPLVQPAPPSARKVPSQRAIA